MTERLVALVVVAASGAYLLSGLALPLGTIAKPGPAFFPLAIGAFGAVMALVWTAAAFRRVPEAAAEPAIRRTRGCASGDRGRPDRVLLPAAVWWVTRLLRSSS